MNRTDFVNKVFSYIDLESDLENFDQIQKTIERDANFRGTNIWILVFAIVVASVGLNMNSTAVIIGAMLISPLMGPINAIGFSAATYNFNLFRKAIKNFGFAVLASLVASTIYFVLSPVSTAHSELLARTSPTIYDVLIALFGGFAGIVAISCKSKGNVIPGVAIATALMPPLCTAGYGLASGQFNFFFGAIFLFIINTVFIALAAMLFSKIAKFPIYNVVEEKRKTQINKITSAIIVITVLPSIYFGYGLIKKEAFNDQASRFTKNVTIFEGNYLLKSEIVPEKRTIKLTYAGNSLSEIQKKRIKERALDFKMKKAVIEIEQGILLSADERNNTEKDLMLNEINMLKSRLARQKEIQDSVVAQKHLGKNLLLEIQALYPEVEACSFAETYRYDINTKKPEEVAMVILSVKGYVKVEDREKIKKWLISRTGMKNIELVFQ